METWEKLGIAPHDFRLIFGRTRIDYDPRKDEANRKKHGYSLESAVYLFEACFAVFSRRRIFTSDSFVENGEVRHQHLVEDEDGAVLMVVTTMRHDETVRVISVRRANSSERAFFVKHWGPRARS